MIHADAGWPHARDEREPMCGRTGEASSALTLLPVRGARSCGEEGEHGGVDGDAQVWDLASVLPGLPETSCWSRRASVSLKRGQGDGGLCVLLGGGVWKPPWGVQGGQNSGGKASPWPECFGRAGF